jgi:putative transposase
VDPIVEKKTGLHVGVDVGLTTFAALSDGTQIANPRHAERAAKKLLRAQRKATRTIRTMQRLQEAKTGRKCDSKTAWRLVREGHLSQPSDFAKPEQATNHRGSRRLERKYKRVARAHLRISYQRKDFHHQTARMLVRKYDHISVESLNMQGLIRSRLARSISDAGWAQFLTMLESKALETDKTFVKVNPRGTSQLCSRCGAVVAKTLAVRIHRCPKCLLKLDRDVNAAINIDARGVLMTPPVSPGRRADGPLLGVEGEGCKRPQRSANRLQQAPEEVKKRSRRTTKQPSHPIQGVLDLPPKKSTLCKDFAG